MQFAKWHGLGNDYILIHDDDVRRDAVSMDAPDVASGQLLSTVAVQRLCDRHFGIGGDGILVFGPSARADATMTIYNPDGSQAEMCGNGIRMAARFLRQNGYVTSDAMEIETAGGVVRPRILGDGRVQVDMGTASQPREVTLQLNDAAGQPASLRAWSVSMGNPHAVVVVDDPESWPLELFGRQAQKAPQFPEGVNLEAIVVEDDRVPMRVWERGVGETLACGSGACAVGVVAVTCLGVDSPVTVSPPGGDLTIEVDEGLRVVMTGPADEVFAGTVDIAALVRTEEGNRHAVRQAT